MRDWPESAAGLRDELNDAGEACEGRLEGAPRDWRPG